MKLSKSVSRHLKLLHDYLTESEGMSFEEHIHSGGRPEEHILWHFLVVHHFLTKGRSPRSIVDDILRK